MRTLLLSAAAGLLSPISDASAAYSAIKDEPLEKAVSLASFGTICEKSSIWTALTSDSTVSGVRNIRFGKIMAEVDAQLSAYEGEIANMRSDLGSLQPRIDEALRLEKTPYADEAFLDELIRKGLAPFTGGESTGVEKAKATGCGDPKQRNGDQSVRGAFKKSRETFAEAAKQSMKGQILFDGEKFQERCAALLGVEGYCERLCQNMRDLANKAAAPPVVTQSTKLLNRQKTLTRTLLEQEEKMRQCRVARVSIAAFQDSLQMHGTKVDARFDDVRKVETAMFDAEENLFALEDSLVEKEEVLDKLLKTVEADNKVAEEAKTSLEALKVEEGGLHNAVKETTAKLEEAGRRLTAAKRADKVIEELRDAVSVTTLKMRLFYEVAVLKPVEDAGLSGTTDLREYFQESMASVPGAQELDDRVVGLTTFCTEEAMPAFQAVKSVDLTPLCKTGDAPSITGDIRASMGARVSKVKELLGQVQSWFDPLKGQDLKEEDVWTRLEMGEPEGLREIVGVYGQAGFYQYLKGWKFKGKYLALISRLGALVQGLSDALTQLQKELLNVKEKHANSIVTRKKAEEKLKEAAQAQGISQEKKARLEEAVEVLRGDTARMHKQMEDYEEMLRLALANLEEAEKQLLVAYKNGTSSEKAPEAALLAK